MGVKLLYRIFAEGIYMRIHKILQKHKDSGKLHSYHYVMFASVYNNNFYKEVRAYSAFFHSKHRRHWKHKDFFFRDCDPVLDYEPRDYKIPEFRHLSIFEFFNHVGYNNAKKNFV